MSDNIEIKKQICVASGFQGSALEELRARLDKLTQLELEAELQKALSGSLVSTDTGLVVEKISVPIEQDRVLVPEQPRRTELSIAQAQDLSIEYLSENLTNAINIYMNMGNGVVASAYDSVKNFFETELSSKNIGLVIDKEQDCMTYLTKAKAGQLTRREYYEKSKERLIDMILVLMKRQDENGISVLDKFKEDLTSENFEKIIDQYLTKTINTISTMQGIKDLQHRLLTADQEKINKFLEGAAKGAKAQVVDSNHPSDMAKLVRFNLADLHPFNSEELLTFEETYELERGVEFSKFKLEALQQSKGEMNVVLSAYNKYQNLKSVVDNLQKQYQKESDFRLDEFGHPIFGSSIEPDAEIRKVEVLAVLNDYYALAPENAIKDLSEAINKQKLNIELKLDEQGKLQLDFNEALQSDNAKNKSLNLLLRAMAKTQEDRLNAILDNKDITEYVETYESEYVSALGERNVEELTKAMEADNVQFVDVTTGTAGMIGMGLLAVGGAIVAAPLVCSAAGIAAPAFLTSIQTVALAEGAISVGGKVAFCSMITRNAAGFADAYKLEEGFSNEDLKRRSKDLVMDIAGFAIGVGAGKMGLQYAANVARSGGSPAMAMLAEHGTDFTLSVVGDLAMIGVIGYDEELGQTLKNNGLGILVSTLTGIKTSKLMYDYNSNRARLEVESDEFQGFEENVGTDNKTDVLGYVSEAIPGSITTVKSKSVSAIKAFAPPPRPDLIEQAVKVNDITRPDLVQFVKDMQDLGFADIQIAKIVNSNKTREGSINRNLLTVYEKIKSLHVSADANLVKVIMNPDGSINQKNLDAVEFLKDQKISVNGMVPWIKVAQGSADESGVTGFSVDRFNELSAIFDKQVSLDRKGIFLENCLDEAGKISPVKMNLVQELFDSGIKESELLVLFGFAKEHNQPWGYYEDLIKFILDKNKYVLSGATSPMVSLKAICNSDGTINRDALAIYKYIVPNSDLAKLAPSLFVMARDNNGNFMKENYEFLIEALNDYSGPNAYSLKTVKILAGYSKDSKGNFVKDYYDKTKILEKLRLTTDAFGIIMKCCLPSNLDNVKDFNMQLFNRTVDIITKQQEADPINVVGTQILLGNQKVVIATTFRDGKVVKTVLNNSVDTEYSSGISESRVDKSVKIYVEKSDDRVGVASKVTKTSTMQMKEYTKIIKDASGQPLRYEHYSPSDIPGIYDVRVRDARTGETKIISSAKIDKDTGNATVIKDFESSGGTRTQYHYTDDPKGNRVIEYKITDKDGIVLMDDKQTFTVVSENKFVSTYNDKSYEIEFTDKTLTVKSQNDNEIAEFDLETFLKDSSDKHMLIDLLKQLPGHELIALNKTTKTLDSSSDMMSSHFNHTDKYLKTGDNVSILSHEGGHGKHSYKTGSKLFEMNPEIRKSYLEELNNFKTIATEQEQEFLAYFIDPTQHANKPWKDLGVIFETIAESNTLLVTYFHSPELAARAHYLQQHFPKTIAAISKIMKDSDFLVKTHDEDPILTQKITRGGDDVIVIDHETLKIMHSAATLLNNKGKSIEKSIAKIMERQGFGTTETQTMTFRTKGVQSLYDKLKNYAVDNYGKMKVLSNAIDSIKDLIGTRTIVKSADYTSHPDVVKLIKSGDTEGAVSRAAELQSEPVLENLKKMIEKEASSKSEISIVRISNYMGKDGIPYFSQRQLSDLKWHAEQLGVKLDFVVRAPESDPKFNQMNIDAANTKNPTKVRESGYTALQINFKTSDGQIFEWQYRGDKVNEFAEAEHVPYDLRTNKDIISANPELAPLYNPIKALLSKDNMKDTIYEKYNEYLTAYYAHLRKLELGFESKEPVLSDYGDFDKRLTAKNLILLHEYAEKVKDAVKNKGEVLDIINEYNKLVNV